MRIVFAGPLHTGSTCFDRVEALRFLGHEVIVFDVNQITTGLNRFQKSLVGRFNFGSAVKRLNEKLIKLCHGTDFDILFVDKGVAIFAETVREARILSKQHIAVHMTPDAQLVDNRSRHFLAAIRGYDVLVTTKPFETELYRAHGARDVLLLLQGYGDRFVAKSATVAHRDKDVVFVGHYQPHYRRCVSALVNQEVPTEVWGPRWDRAARMHSALKNAVQGPGLWGDSYPDTLRRCKIALGLLGKHIPETTTTRSFEIPATGTFMLAERTDDHLSLFEEDREAVFFSGDEELCDKARFYLSHTPQRDAIAIAGRERSMRSGYHVNEQMRKLMLHLETKYHVS